VRSFIFSSHSILISRRVNLLLQVKPYFRWFGSSMRMIREKNNSKHVAVNDDVPDGAYRRVNM